MCDKFAKKPKLLRVAEKVLVDGSQESTGHALSPVIYPKANIYYAFAEDTHPTARIAVAKSLQRRRCPASTPPSCDVSLQDPRSADEAAIRYLSTDPPSFVIFGKPGLNSAGLASAIADAWNCVLVSPSSLIQREVDSGSEEGRRMRKILVNGDCVAPDVVMDLIRRRIRLRDVRHRGYVVEGLPLILNETDFSRKLPEDQTCDPTCSCRPETPDDAVPVHPDYEREIPQQVNEMFTTWPKKPHVIVYMVCPNEDVSLVVRRQSAETATADTVEDTLDDGSKPSLNRRDMEQLIMNGDRESEDLKVQLQCDLYARLALPVIDRWILAHDPQRVIRVDGRSSTQRILQTLDARLHRLPMQPPILPKPMMFETENSEPSEDNESDPEKSDAELPKPMMFETENSEPSEDNESDPEKSDAEKAFEILQYRQIVSAEFPWRLSAWKFCCPVELAQGRTSIGCAEHAVQFLRNIFFLSSQQAVEMFVENPRTFLLPPNPRPSCKIAVVGPNRSSRSELSARLAEVFGGTVIKLDDSNIDEEQQPIIVQKIEEMSKQELEDGLYRDGGYIVDGILILQLHEIVKSIEFKHIVFIYDSRDMFYGRFLTDMSALMKPFNNYKHVYDFDLIMSNFKQYTCKEVIACDLHKVDNMTEYVMDRIKFPFEAAIRATNAMETEPLQEANTNEIEEEQTPLSVDLETAERLLGCGYYFLSSFGRRCPVQVFNAFPSGQSPLFPVVYHAYVYFLAGEEALSAFLKEPAKYLTQDPRSPDLPLRLAVIGPPGCGKTTLADRFAKTYGLKRITRDVASRHTLKHYSWSTLARTAEDQLRAGRPAPVEFMTRAIETLSLGPRATSHGYVLDDCPSSRDEAERLILSGVQPLIVLDLKAELPFCLKLQTEDDDGATDTCSGFMARYEDWQVHQADFRSWLKRFSRNVVEVDATRSKWGVWTAANEAVRWRFEEIRLYHRDADLDKVHSLRHLCVSPFEFRERQSRFEFYCPVCLFRDKVLQASRQPTDNEGMVQYQKHFYWLCPRHMAAFVAKPQQHLPPVNTASLPDERPRVIEQVVDVGHVCWERRLRLQGWCPVSYVDGPANRKLVRGRADLAVLLGEEKVYLLCSEECRNKFLARHSDYSNVEIMCPREVDAWSLPDFLERTLAKEVVEAVKRVAAQRPKIVGLSAAASAAIHIGVHLKTHNEASDLNETFVYEAAGARMSERDKIVRIVTEAAKKRPDPFSESLAKHCTVDGGQ